MKTQADRFRDPQLLEALDAAISKGAAARAPLYDRLRRLSGLPGPRMNVALIKAFAGEIAQRGAVADPLVAALIAIHEDVAPYGHVDEFLPVLGVAATGARAATDPKVRKKLLEVLEEEACDGRFRVRDEASNALVAIALAEGPSFADVFERWIGDEQPFLARAAIAALGDAGVLAMIGEARVVQLVALALDRVGREHRGGRRHDAFHRLLRAIEVTFPLIVTRFASSVQVLEQKAVTEDEDVQQLIGHVARSLKGRSQERAIAIEAALAAQKKPSRDPRWDRLPGKRGRGR